MGKIKTLIICVYLTVLFFIDVLILFMIPFNTPSPYLYISLWSFIVMNLVGVLLHLIIITIILGIKTYKEIKVKIEIKTNN